MSLATHVNPTHQIAFRISRSRVCFQYRKWQGHDYPLSIRFEFVNMLPAFVTDWFYTHSTPTYDP